MKDIVPFVAWCRKNGGGPNHLCIPGKTVAICGTHCRVPGATENGPRCGDCIRLYLTTMTATDELVGAFDELGRVR